jgi:ABC-type sugar transport system ATPase subunit
MATVSIQSVSKYYHEHPVLRDITLNINRGEFVTVVGPSGCGKSTLLRLVAGLELITEGHILINNRCVNDLPASARDMAMVFQNYALYPHMTVYDNMAYGLKIRGLSKAEMARRVHEVADLLKLETYLTRKPAALSGGQRQRVGIGRAMVRSPAVFLFDEPLSNLDAKLKTEMRHEIKKLHQQFKTTSLYVTHDQTEAMTLADRVVMLNAGCIEQVGTPADVYHFPASCFVANFTGHYPFNTIPARVNRAQQCLDTDFGFCLPLPTGIGKLNDNQAVLIGARAEHLILKNTPGLIAASIAFVDDLGSDKLVEVNTIQGHLKLMIRALERDIIQTSHVGVNLQLERAHIFCAVTGKRLGGWHEKEAAAAGGSIS